jgi:hypothetical protein
MPRGPTLHPRPLLDPFTLAVDNDYHFYHFWPRLPLFFGGICMCLQGFAGAGRSPKMPTPKRFLGLRPSLGNHFDKLGVTGSSPVSPTSRHRLTGTVGGCFLLLWSVLTAIVQSTDEDACLHRGGNDCNVRITGLTPGPNPGSGAKAIGP